MTAPDFPDFTQSVGFVDKASVLVPDTVLADGGFIDNIDTSQWQSVCVVFVPAAAGTNFNTQMQLTWSEAGQAVFEDGATVNTNSLDNNLPGAYRWLMPVRGSTLRLDLNAQNPAGGDITIIGYSRPTYAAKLSNFGLSTSPLLLDTGNVAVAAGAISAAFHIKATTKGYWITTNTALAKARTQLEFASFVQGTGWGNNPALNLTGDGSVNGQAAVPVGFTCGFIQFHNDDTVAHTWQCQVWELT